MNPSSSWIAFPEANLRGLGLHEARSVGCTVLGVGASGFQGSGASRSVKQGVGLRVWGFLSTCLPSLPCQFMFVSERC